MFPKSFFVATQLDANGEGRARRTMTTKIAPRAAKNFKNVKYFKRKDTNDKYWTEKIWWRHRALISQQNSQRSVHINLCLCLSFRVSLRVAISAETILINCQFAFVRSHTAWFLFYCSFLPFFLFSRSREHRLACGINKKLCKHSLLIQLHNLHRKTIFYNSFHLPSKKLQEQSRELNWFGMSEPRDAIDCKFCSGTVKS